jgi:hypothetical protein
MKGKIIIGLIFIFATTICQAQINSKYIPPDMTAKTHSFVLPELRVDSIFIENLNTALYDKNDRYLKNIISNPREKLWRHFHIQFKKIDSLNYCLEVSLLDIPARKSTGFFEHNGFFYWFGNDAPPNIVLETESKKHFSYKEHLPAPYDPPFWFFMYNVETGNIEVKEENCD